MVKVAVCDDERIHRKSIISVVNEIFDRHKKALHIDGYGDTHALMEAYGDHTVAYDLLILDICMPGQSGMDLAKAIRAHDHDVHIIFVTSSPDYVYEGYDVHALHYLLKPLQSHKLEKILMDLWARNQARNYLSIRKKGKIHKIPYQDIVYLESKDKKIRITTVNDIIDTYGKLSDIMHKLPDDCFIFTHKSYIVNFGHTVNLSTKGFMLKDGTTIPVSRSHHQKVQKAFLRYLNL